MPSACQWVDVMKGEPPLSLTELPCDHWEPKEGPEAGTQALVCFECGWYRIIPNEDAIPARILRETIDFLFGEKEY